MLSAQWKGLLTDTSELRSKDDISKVSIGNYGSSEDEKSDASIKLPKQTGHFDKDIPATPKIAKSVRGLKVKRSKSASTSKATVKVYLKDGNDTDSSEVFLPCSGIVSGTYDYIFIMA